MNRDGISIFVFSLIVLALEILITRIISVVLGPNFVYLVIGLAILGFSAAGACIAFSRRRADRHRSFRTDRHAAAFALTLAPAVLVICFITPYLGADMKMGVGIVCSVLAVPFFFGGMVIVSLLTARADRIGLIYGLNLAGSGLGCLIPVIGLNFISAGALLIMLGASASLAVFLLPSGGKRAYRIGPAVLNWVLLIIWLPILTDPLFIRPVSYKELSYLIDERPDLNIEYQAWSPVGRVDVVSVDDPYIYLPEKIEYKLVTQDGNAPSMILSPAKPLDEAGPAGRSILALPYLMTENPDVLIIGPGGGPDVAAALHYSKGKITCVELNRKMIDIVKEHFAGFAGGLYQKENVRVIHDEGRHYLARTDERFDLIQLTGVDTFLASSLGVTQNLNENYLYTREAFRLYLDRLSAEGLLSISYPAAGVAPRLFLMALRALEERGVQSPEACIIVSLTKGYNNILVRKRPFEEKEKQALQRFFREPLYGLFFPLYHRLWGKPEPEFFAADAILYLPGVRQQGLYQDILRSWKNQDLDAFLSGLSINLAEVTDDRPFIFIRDKWFGDRPHYNEFLMITAVILLPGLVLWVLPFYLTQFRALQPSVIKTVLFYFSAIGCGFIMIEISLIQKFILFLGHPAYALMVVISSLLVFAGAGSAYSGKQGAKFSTFGARTAALAASLIACLFVYDQVLVKFFIPSPWIVRCALAAMVLAPLGFFLGMPFPAGIALLKRKGLAGLIPWAWGINGAASVAGSMLNLLAGMTFGLTGALMIAAGFYGAAWMTLRQKSCKKNA
jgi:SAM-dependent methyltransferase